MWPVCPMCELPVYLAGLDMHPCCAQAKDRGETRCGGCEGYRHRSTTEAEGRRRW